MVAFCPILFIIFRGLIVIFFSFIITIHIFFVIFIILEAIVFGPINRILMKLIYSFYLFIVYNNFCHRHVFNAPYSDCLIITCACKNKGISRIPMNSINDLCMTFNLSYQVSFFFVPYINSGILTSTKNKAFIYTTESAFYDKHLLLMPSKTMNYFPSI